MADGNKVVQFEENPTKTRQGGLRNKTRSSHQQMWCTDGGERDPVRLFEEWLARRPEPMKNSGPCTWQLFLGPPQMFGTPNLEWENIESAK